MSDKIHNVLFLCTGNSARSILGEALMNKLGKGRFRAYSAGSKPQGEVHPMTLEVLSSYGFATGGLHSKTWNEFTATGAPEFDFISTVCDSAAGESCPVFPASRSPRTGAWKTLPPWRVRANARRSSKRSAICAAASSCS